MKEMEKYISGENWMVAEFEKDLKDLPEYSSIISLCDSLKKLGVIADYYQLFNNSPTTILKLFFLLKNKSYYGKVRGTIEKKLGSAKWPLVGADDQSNGRFLACVAKDLAKVASSVLKNPGALAYLFVQSFKEVGIPDKVLCTTAKMFLRDLSLFKTEILKDNHSFGLEEIKREWVNVLKDRQLFSLSSNQCALLIHYFLNPFHRNLVYSFDYTLAEEIKKRFTR